MGIYVFQGDRFLCCKNKEDIVSESLKKSNCEIKNIDDNITASAFTWNVNSKEIFGSKNKIFILDNIVPEPSEDIIPLINNLPKNITLIFLFTEKNKIDKRTKIGKLLDSFCKEYPSMFNDKGFLDQKQIEKSKSLIRELSSWNGSDQCLDYIMDKCDYEYGSILEEIEKINTYLGRDPSSVEEIKEIVCDNDLLRLDSVFEKIKSRNILGSLEEVQGFLEGDNYKSNYMMFFLGLLENLNFMLYCKMANDLGISDVSGIVNFVSENYTKSGKKILPQSIQGRYFFTKDYLAKWKVGDLQFAISKIEESIKTSILGVRSERFIVENFLAQIV